MKTVLITGAAGFIGSHAVEHVLSRTNWNVIALDGLTYAGDVRNYIESDYYNPDRVEHIYHDLRSPIPDHVARRLQEVDYVWHFASDSHVDRSLEDPVPFFTGNCAITVNTLEWARTVDIEQFVQISTDEVYGPTVPGQEHKEWADILPSNPYSASKAAQESISIAYWRSYGVPVVITNTMNNFGERQHEEKFVPLVIKKLLRSETISVHAQLNELWEWVSGSRYWLHARNHADALLFLSDFPVSTFEDSDRPDRYNITGEQYTNERIVQLIAEIMGVEPNMKFEDAHSQRPGHDLHYGLDGSLLEGMGWTAPVHFKKALEKTVSWYLEKGDLNAYSSN